MNAILLAVLLVPAAQPEDFSTAFVRDVKPFLTRHCYSCHDARKARAGFRIDQLGIDFRVGKTADHWKEVIDQINSGAMPPKDSPRPNPKDSFAVVEWVGHALKRAQREARMAGGRTLLRRLNRDEYVNTVGDLLRLDPKFLTRFREELPADGQAEGFDRVASALFIDQTQLEKYLAIADSIARQAILAAPPRPQTYVYQPERHMRNDRKTVEVAQAIKHSIPLGPTFFEVRSNGVEMWGGHGHRAMPFALVPHGPRPELTALVKEDGYYRVRVRGGAIRGERREPVQLRLTYAGNTPLESQHLIEVRGTIEKPEVTEAVLFLRAGQPDQKKQFALHWNGINDIRINNPRWDRLHIRWLVVMGKRGKAAAARDKERMAKLGQELQAVLAEMHAFNEPRWLPNPRYDLTKVPRLFLDSIEVEGPITKEWPPASHVALGLTDALPHNEKGVRALFSTFLPRAYRRPVTPDQIDRVVRVVMTGLERDKLSFHEALRLGLQMVLCSPGFLYLPEIRAESDRTRRPLTDHELASRLSYFLWATMPDPTLLELASAEKLRDPATLRAQVDRLLRDPKSRRFVDGFAGQWLDVRQYGTVMPAREYRDYDKALEVAGKEEPLAFFQHVLGQNLPITTFLDSDFLVINDRLARHYGIDGVVGSEFRKVPIRREHHRGGVLGMAGLLTLLSDGNRTLPVRRAAWVLEHLLNDPPPPPPPNAGDIQPNTAGKLLSVRERLALHRNEPTCASCHTRLDPYGLALENYDAIGAWRTIQNGEGIRSAKAPKIDPSGTLKSGRAFSTLEEFKSALISEKERFRRAFAEKMLTYALCRPVGYIDRKTIDQLTAALAKDGDRIQTLIQAIVASEPFLTK